MHVQDIDSAAEQARTVLDRGLAERGEAHVVVDELAGATRAVQRAGAVVERRAIDEAIADAADTRNAQRAREAMPADRELERRAVFEG